MRDPIAPRFSIVTAVYNVEPYLPEFIASIDAQRYDADNIEVIAVDDGSTDGSPALLAAWAERSNGRVQVVRQANAGQAAARNAGLELARGEWVTFSDPDDMLDRDFFAAAARFAAAHRDVDVLAVRPIILREERDALQDTHPRRAQFDGGDRVVDLDEEPEIFLGTSAGSLYRRSVIERAGLRFDTRVQPNFEDGHFAVRFLFALDATTVGVLRGAKYIYRKRQARDSTLNRSVSDRGRYTDVYEHGYLSLLESARTRYGRVPEWLQHLIVYELSWYLAEDEKVSTEIVMAPDVVPQFHELFHRVTGYLDPGVVAVHDVRQLKPVWVDIMSAGGRDGWVAPVAIRDKVDRATRLQRITYRYVGQPPAEAFEASGQSVEVAFGKHAARVYYRRPMINERVAWIPSIRDVTLTVNGTVMPIVAPGNGRPRGARRALPSGPRLRLASRSRALGRRAVQRLARARTEWLARGLELVASMPPWRRRFGGAWVLMDRIYEADDSGERLFEYLRAHRPDINAWFVLASTSSDWDRMQQAWGERLIRRGSLAWRLLMVRATWLVSSHADRDVVMPPELTRLSGRRPWRFAFLQHGVMKDDLSVWLNPKDIDMFVVSTEAELESVVADGTAYIYTTKEARLTGLPRFDRLLRKAHEVSEDDRGLVLVAPTWRSWLAEPLESPELRRGVVGGFRDSAFFRNWLAILSSPRIAAAAADAGVRIAFMPHPNFQNLHGEIDLPEHVEWLAFAGNDVQGLYARSALLVTDYSSVAFNVALIDRPIVYFQFDRDAVMSGAHLGRQGYFDYERDGFGPVATNLDDAVDAIVKTLAAGPRPSPEYQRRIDATFTVRDGRACERVVTAIEELSRPFRHPTR